MNDFEKIVHELITEYRMPKEFDYHVEDAKIDLENAKSNFINCLSKEQLEKFSDLNKKAFRVVYFELKKYYFLGYDTAIKKSDA